MVILEGGEIVDIALDDDPQALWLAVLSDFAGGVDAGHVDG